MRSKLRSLTPLLFLLFSSPVMGSSWCVLWRTLLRTFIVTVTLKYQQISPKQPSFLTTNTTHPWYKWSYIFRWFRQEYARQQTDYLEEGPQIQTVTHYRCGHVFHAYVDCSVHAVLLKIKHWGLIVMITMSAVTEVSKSKLFWWINNTTRSVQMNYWLTEVVFTHVKMLTSDLKCRKCNLI